MTDYLGWVATAVFVSSYFFKRPALLREEQERLQGIYDGTADVGRLRMNVNARFGEYDAGLLRIEPAERYGEGIAVGMEIEEGERV